MNKKIKIIIISCIASSLILFLILFFTIPRINYKYNAETDSYEITGSMGIINNLTIKSEYKDKPVTKINERAFQYKNIKTITFEENSNIITIEKLAFNECKYLKEVNLPISVRYIEQNAFSYCDSLESFKIEEDTLLDAIPGSMFFNCTSLSYVYIPSKVTSIGSLAFFNCTSLKELDINSKLTIYEGAFYGCTITINSVKDITLRDNYDYNANITIVYKD